MLSSTDEEERRKAATLSVAKRRFQDMIDELFSYITQKDRPETERYQLSIRMANYYSLIKPVVR